MGLSAFWKAAAENIGGGFGLTCADQSGTPGKQQAGILGWIFGERLEDLNGLGIFFFDEIAQAEELPDKRVFGTGSDERSKGGTASE